MPKKVPVVINMGELTKGVIRRPDRSIREGFQRPGMELGVTHVRQIGCWEPTEPGRTLVRQIRPYCSLPRHSTFPSAYIDERPGIPGYKLRFVFLKDFSPLPHITEKKVLNRVFNLIQHLKIG